MRTVRCSGCLWGRVGVSAQGGVCLGGCLPREGVCPGGVCLGGQTPPPWTEWQTNVKHYLAVTRLRTVIITNVENKTERKTMVNWKNTQKVVSNISTVVTEYCKVKGQRKKRKLSIGGWLWLQKNLNRGRGRKLSVGAFVFFHWSQDLWCLVFTKEVVHYGWIINNRYCSIVLIFTSFWLYYVSKKNVHRQK